MIKIARIFISKPSEYREIWFRRQKKDLHRGGLFLFHKLKINYFFFLASLGAAFDASGEFTVKSSTSKTKVAPPGILGGAP